jgi:hypothetical protein
MNAWLQAQDTEFMWLVVVPVALCLVMVLAGILGSLRR